MSNEYIVQTKRVGKYEIRIKYDMDARSYMDPAEEFDPFEILYTSTHYTLGTSWVGSGEEIEEYAKEIEEEGGLVLPVFAHIHGGVSMSTGSFGDPWDSGQSGVIVLSKEDWDKHFPGYEKEFLYESMSATVKTFGKWANGEVYEWVIVDRITGDEVDTCGGFFSMKEAMAHAVSEATARAREDATAPDALCKSTMITTSTRYDIRGKFVRVRTYAENGDEVDTNYKLKEGADILAFLKDNLERVSHE